MSLRSRRRLTFLKKYSADGYHGRISSRYSETRVVNEKTVELSSSLHWKAYKRRRAPGHFEKRKRSFIDRAFLIGDSMD